MKGHLYEEIEIPHDWEYPYRSCLVVETEIFKKIQERVAEGRWEIAGAMWVEPDCLFPSGESLIRHFLYSKCESRETTANILAGGEEFEVTLAPNQVKSFTSDGNKLKECSMIERDQA